MPVEIKELIIRATISDDSKDNVKSESSTDRIDPEEMISACVEQVLNILEQSKER